MFIPPNSTNAGNIDSSIEQLKQNLDENEIAPLILALEALKEDPQDKALLADLTNAFHGLKTSQGAVLAYAPFLSVVLMEDPFDKEENAAPVSMKLVQKHPIKGTQEFELLEDSIIMRIKKPFRKAEELTVMLAVLNPEPVVNKSMLDFHSRVKCDPLISLYIDKPNPQEFNTFVAALKQQAQLEYNAFAGIK